jgi:hypothetical protein
MTTGSEVTFTHPVVGAVNAANGGLKSIHDAAYFGLSDADLESALEGCEQLRARVFDTTLALAAEADERDLGRRLGASSTAAWLRDRYRLRPGDARRLVELAHRTRVDDGPVDYAANVRGAVTGREMPATAAALADGAISPEHVMVVGKVLRNLPESVSVDQAQQAERDLAGFCREYDPLTVAKLGDYLLHVLDADAPGDRDGERRRRRELRLNESTGGVSGTLTAEGLALLRTALDPLAAPAPAADGTPDPRSPGQRLADALVELARRAIAADRYPANHGVAHRVMVIAGLDTLTAGHTCPDSAEGSGAAPRESRSNQAGPAEEANDADLTTEPTGPANHTGPAAQPTGQVNDTGSAPQAGVTHPAGDTGAPAGPGPDRPVTAAADAARAAGAGVAPAELIWGGAISAAAARRIACHAGIQRVILDPTGAVLDVGREYRTVTPAQFIALTARDGGCAFPGCTRNPSWCIAHHIIHWIDGGETNLDNLVLLCQYHHTVIHHHGWDVETAADRRPDFYPPPWIDPDRQPRRNNRPNIRHRSPGPAP